MNIYGIMIKIPSFLFVAIVMDVLKSLAWCWANAEFDDEVGPKDMHSVEDKSHNEKVAVFEADHVPLILRGGLVRVNISKQAEWKDYDPEIYPDTCHQDIHYFYVVLSLVLSFYERSAKGYEDITGIMNNKDH